MEEQIVKNLNTQDNIKKWLKILFYIVAVFGVLATLFKLEPFFSVIVEVTPLFALGGFIFGIIALDRV